MDARPAMGGVEEESEAARRRRMLDAVREKQRESTKGSRQAPPWMKTSQLPGRSGSWDGEGGEVFSEAGIQMSRVWRERAWERGR